MGITLSRRPLHEPVPVGALVPQYYGYYIPDEDIPVRKEKRAAVVDEVGQSDTGDVGGGEELDNMQPENTAQTEAGSDMDVDDQAQNDDNQDGEQSGSDDASMAPATDRKKDEEEDEEKFHYRSPIILMENCGRPIDIDALNIDDK